jgi:hypothetical protein
MYTILSPSPHSKCVVAVSHNGIAKVLVLSEYVASTAKSRTHNKPTSVRSSIDTGEVTTSGLKPDASQDSARSQFNIINIIAFTTHKTELSRAR